MKNCTKYGRGEVTAGVDAAADKKHSCPCGEERRAVKCRHCQAASQGGHGASRRMKIEFLKFKDTTFCCLCVCVWACVAVCMCVCVGENGWWCV